VLGTIPHDKGPDQTQAANDHKDDEANRQKRIFFTSTPTAAYSLTQTWANNSR
jgi:hypothetical protein